MREHDGVKYRIHIEDVYSTPTAGVNEIYKKGYVYYIDDYDYEDGYVVVVYMLNSKLEKDFELVKQGKYSKTSPAFQSIFPKVVKLKRNGLYKDEISLQYRIFNKTEDLRKYWEDRFDAELDADMEVWSTFIEEDEILKLDKIKNNV